MLSVQVDVVEFHVAVAFQAQRISATGTGIESPPGGVHIIDIRNESDTSTRAYDGSVRVWYGVSEVVRLAVA